MVDLGYIGQRFTWMTRRGVDEEIWVKLDRVVCSMDWRLRFPECFVKHLPRVMSDHCSLFLQLHSSHIPKSSLKLFKFEVMWLKHRDFADFVSLNWGTQNVSIIEKVNQLTGPLKVWNRKKFGCIFHNKRKIFVRIQGVQTCLSRSFSARLSAIKAQLLEEYNRLLEQE
ncbi:hypothetical protein ACOSQ3_013545 [Xanthoceras sorbifolium]